MRPKGKSIINRYATARLPACAALMGAAAGPSMADGPPSKRAPLWLQLAPIATTRPPEKYDDPPQNETFLALRASGPAAVVQRGAFASVQVNVNSQGNNIVNDAANEPSIAVNPANPNQIVIAWRQFDYVGSNFREAGIGYTHDGGQTWSTYTLDNGQFRSDPVLAADATGRFFLSSLSTITSVEVFRSIDGGEHWLETSAFGGDKQWMIVDPRSDGEGAGHVYQNWNVQFSCCAAADFTRSITGGMSFQSPLAIPTPSMKWGTMDTGTDGTLYLAGSRLNNSGHLFTKSTIARNPAATPTFDPVTDIDLGGDSVTGGINPAGLLGQVWIAVDESTGPSAGNIYVLGSVSNGLELLVNFIRSTDGGQTWSAPVTVNDDPGSIAWHWFGTMSVAPNGRIDAIWNDTRNDPDNVFTEVYYSFSVDAGTTWSPNVPLTPPWDPSLGYPKQDKIGDYYHMVSDNGGAHLAYAATFNGGQDVYYLRIPRDCNSNGIEDDCDVRCGVTGTRCDVAGCGRRPDCNSNDIPDSCELTAATDCQPNGTLDSCEIANGTCPDVLPPIGECDDCNAPDCSRVRTALPANCFIDARQPHAPNHPADLQTTSQVALSFDAGCAAGAEAGDFAIACDPQGAACPAISSVEVAGDVVICNLSVPIPAGRWTCIIHNVSGDQICVGSLPGDTNSNGTSSPADILELIDQLNGVPVPSAPLHQCDIDRSGLCTPGDILSEIDLLNGASGFAAWSGRFLPMCPSAP